MRKIFWTILGVLTAAVCTFLLFLPFPKTVEGDKEYYSCRWENGIVTTESYYTAFSAFTGVFDGDILLERDGRNGKIEASEAFLQAVEVFERGELAELLSLKIGDVSRLEYAALYALYGGRGYYSDEFFAWDGEQFFRTNRTDFPEVFLMTGNISANTLIKTGAKKLIVGEYAELKAKSLVGTCVEEVEARAPYFEQGGGIYLQTVSGVRLIAALPNVKELVIDCDYIDEGALAPCKELEKLSLPAWYDGTLKILFGDQPIPETLTRS